MTSTINEQTSEVTGQLPIGAPAEPISMVSLPEVPNGPFPRPHPLSLVTEFISPFPLPGSISPLHLVDADMRTDQRLPPVRIEKPEAPWKKNAEFCRGSTRNPGNSVVFIEKTATALKQETRSLLNSESFFSG